MEKALESGENQPGTMDVWAHINELRKRLMVALLAMVITTMLSFAGAQYLINLIARPIGGLEKLQAIEVTENISVFMRVSLLSGFILALPIILYEIIAFIMPGLEPGERRWLLSAIPLATILFLAGVAFAYFVMLPTAIPFLTGFLGIKNIPRVSNYIAFVTNLLFWIGVSFETPLLVFILAKLRIVDAAMLAKQWRVAIVVIAVIAAMVTPTVDPVNMGLLMAPLFVLYLLSIVLAKIARAGEKDEE